MVARFACSGLWAIYCSSLTPPSPSGEGEGPPLQIFGASEWLTSPKTGWHYLEASALPVLCVIELM